MLRNRLKHLIMILLNGLIVYITLMKMVLSPVRTMVLFGVETHHRQGTTTVMMKMQVPMVPLEKSVMVCSMIGSSINQNNGDYSRGASGFWFKDGKISHPVNECTIAGNLTQMIKNMTIILASYRL